MKNIISISIFEFKKNIRDLKMLLLLIVAPLILIFILGKSLDSLLTMNSMPTPIVGYVNLDEGDLSENFEQFIRSDQLKEIIQIKDFTSQELASLALEKGEVDSIILINKDFSSQLSSGKQASLEIYGKKNSTYVETIVNNYVNSYNLSVSFIKHTIPSIGMTSQIELERGELNSEGIYPNSMDYYSIHTLLQVLILSSVFGVSIIHRDLTGGLKIRMNSIPIKKHQLIIGRLIGSIFYAFISAIVTILFSKFVFKANWNGNVLLIGLAIFLFVVIVIGIGVLLGIFTKNSTTAFGVIALLSLVFSASVGAFSPKTTVKAISYISPNLYAKNIILGTIFDFPNRIILEGFFGLVIMVVVIYGFIFFIEGRRKYAIL